VIEGIKGRREAKGSKVLKVQLSMNVQSIPKILSNQAKHRTPHIKAIISQEGVAEALIIIRNKYRSIHSKYIKRTEDVRQSNTITPFIMPKIN